MTLSFVFANVVILILTFVVFHFLNSLNLEFEALMSREGQVTLVADEVKISAMTILKNQRRIFISGDNQLREKTIGLCESMKSQLDRLDVLYDSPEVKKILAQMSSYVDSLSVILSRTTFANNEQNYSSTEDLAEKILESYSSFSEIQHNENSNRRQKYNDIIEEIKKNMMITLLIGLLGTIILGFIVPGKIALPFKKIKDAIRELQECNFDVNIYYNQDDEIGEMAREMNKMIQSIKVFEELRANKISVENRKFDALANMVKKPILVSNAKGELIYINNHLYSLLQCQSSEVLERPMKETVIPKSIIHSYELAIKRRSKIENEKVVIPAKVEESPSGEEDKSPGEKAEGGEKNHHEGEPIFKGYANVIPIRGKKSSLDYYLMILSKEVMT